MITPKYLNEASIGPNDLMPAKYNNKYTSDFTTEHQVSFEHALGRTDEGLLKCANMLEPIAGKLVGLVASLENLEIVSMRHFFNNAVEREAAYKKEIEKLKTENASMKRLLKIAGIETDEEKRLRFAWPK